MSLVNDIAAIIRRVDGNNRMSARELGSTIATTLLAEAGGYRNRIQGNFPLEDDFADAVEAVNPNKTMSAGNLAEALIDHLHLDA